MVPSSSYNRFSHILFPLQQQSYALHELFALKLKNNALILDQKELRNKIMMVLDSSPETTDF